MEYILIAIGSVAFAVAVSWLTVESVKLMDKDE